MVLRGIQGSKGKHGKYRRNVKKKLKKKDRLHERMERGPNKQGENKPTGGLGSYVKSHTSSRTEGKSSSMSEGMQTVGILTGEGKSSPEKGRKSKGTQRKRGQKITTGHGGRAKTDTKGHV